MLYSKRSKRTDTGKKNFNYCRLMSEFQGLSNNLGISKTNTFLFWLISLIIAIFRFFLQKGNNMVNLRINILYYEKSLNSIKKCDGIN